jgi:type IV pilus assembly protein PilM
LEIGEDRIRAVELRRSGRSIQLHALGTAPVPQGALRGGTVEDVRLLAEGVRRALREHHVSGTMAVVGLPGRAAASRVLELPAMRKDELRAVVAGEMEHYRMIPAGQGTFDFVTLGEEQQDGNGQVRLLLMAADKKIVDSYREVLRLAGLQMLALEPLSLAASRSAFSSLSSGGVAMVVVGPRTTELAIFKDGVLCYSRQFDTGTLDLVARSPSGALDLTQDEGHEEETKTPQADSELPQLGGAVGGDLPSLLYELRRSLDFYHREAPRSAQVERIVLSADAERLKGLDGYLEASLGLPVSLCQPFQGVLNSNPQLSPEHLARVGPAYASATGLALRALGEVPQAPCLDLSDTGVESRLAKVAPRWLTYALGISIAMVVAACLGYLLTGRALNTRERLLAASKAELARVAQLEQERTSAARRVQEARAIVELRGLPWSDILFQVAEFMPEGVWLTNLQVDSGNTLTMAGLALSADSVATLMDSLTRSRLFAGPRMTFVQKDTAGRRPLVRYQIKVTVTQPAPAGASASGRPIVPGGQP